MTNSKKKSDKRKDVICISKETYLDYVGVEAKKRVGENIQIKGTIHEIVIRDSKNISLENISKGKISSLTKSTTAKSADIVTLKNGKVVERIQAKDLVNSSSISDLNKKIKTKQYQNAKLVGTDETVELYNKSVKGVGKKMTSSKISSKTTTRIADNVGVKLPNKDIFINNLKDIHGQSKQSAIVGGSLTGIVSVVLNGKRLAKSEICGAEFATEVVKDVVVSGSSAAIKTGVALTIKEGGKQIAKRVGKESLKKIAGSNVGTAVAFGIVDQGLHTIKLINGDIDGSEYLGKTAENVGGTSGALGGAYGGAALGTAIFPGVGTAIGAVVFGIAGGLGGSSIGSWVKSWFD
ncbi:MAG: hypothetical protein COW71_06430 [Ignavibacteriales bacterium CG18_big_fil_WC_8_21_14_2_50_31_20]|nr:MAG: hypothetical protein COW71_06430 [Ignavibacteriales bacterium CG18_big_fil_WC_8_21_14_2_50_31_20]